MIATICVLTTACGGGGGDGSVNSTPPPPPPPFFTSFSAVQPNSTVTANGSSLEGTMAVSSSGFIPPATVSTPSETSSSIRFTTDAQRFTSSVSLTGSNSSVSFPSLSTAIVNSFTDTAGKVVATGVSNSSRSDQLLFADPYSLGFNYQTFGVWGTGIVAGQTARYGAVSGGAVTTANAVPTSGTANFNGFIGGIYLDTAGEGFRYGANAAFAVNFGVRSISMTTSGDRLVNVNTNVAYIWNTPLTAAMTYATGSSRFSGTFRAGNFMSGTGSGTFYGPAANELGGTFFISGSAGKMVGGFGAKQ